MKVDVGEIPIWLGTQRMPRVDVAPFGFEIGERGLIRMSNNDIVSRMVKSYAHNEYHFMTSPPGSSEWGNVLAAKSLSGLLQLYGDVKGKRILEVGGGTLYSAAILIQKHGAAHVTIVDPALREKPRFPQISVVSDYYSEDMTFDTKFDLIISFNTLEHVPDPIAFLRALRVNLSEDTALYLKLPESGDSLMIGDLGLCAHEHLSYFTPELLDVCMRAAGLARVSNANYLGALQVLARRAEFDFKARFDASERLLSSFAEQYKMHLSRLHERSERYRKIALVGASAGLSNILYLSGLHKKVQVGIFDNDSLKHGEYLPGVDVPIRKPNESALAEYDAIFITPVNFFAEIKKGLLDKSEIAGKPIYPVFDSAPG